MSDLCQLPLYYLIITNVSTNLSNIEIKTNKTNLTLIGVQPGEIYYVEISLTNARNGSIFYIEG